MDDDTATTLGLLWRSTRRLWLAAFVAAFPVVFLLDRWADPAVSPVIPGLIALAILWVVGPFAMMELRRKVPPMAKAQRSMMHANYALGLASLWFFLWLVFLV